MAADWYQPDENDTCINYEKRRKCDNCVYARRRPDINTMTAKDYLFYLKQNKGGVSCHQGRIAQMFACTAKDMSPRCAD
jgi:hypothetical protein